MNTQTKEVTILKTVICYYSRHHKNTKKVLEAMTHNENMDLIAEAAIRAADAEGESISVRCSLEIESFPTRQYDTFSLPAGKYTSLRVIIDQGQGHNWWCVIYPKVCSDTVVEKEDFQELGLSEDETDLITESGTEYKIKFKLLEVIEEIKTALFDK